MNPREQIQARLTSIECEDSVEQHRQVRQACGVTFLKDQVCLDVQGTDRKKLLHSLLSNEIDALEPGWGNEAHLLTPKGKVQATMEVFALQDGFRLITTRDLYDSLFKNIQMRIFRSDVHLIDKQDDFVVLGLFGPFAQRILTDVNPQVAHLEKEYQHQDINLFGNNAMVIRQHLIGEVGYFVLANNKDSATIWDGLVDLPEIKPFGRAAMESLLLESGVPIYGTDFNEDNLSLEVNLNKAVSNTKGCYLGQEPVARILSRGHVAKRLVGLEMEGNRLPPSGTEIFTGEAEVTNTDSRPLGAVTRSAFSPTLNKPLALAFLKYNYLEENADGQVVLADGKRNILGKARWVELPFYRSGSVNWLDGGPQMQKIIAPNPKSRK